MKSIRMVILFLACLSLEQTASGQSAPDLLKEAAAALAANQADAALALANKAVAKDPHFSAGYFFRGSLLESRGKHALALTDFDELLEIDPQQTEAYHVRGCVHFKLGHFKESVREFDKYVELNPKRKASHWQRGISTYYAGRYDDGRKQFEGYQDFDSNDVENALWRYMCMAKAGGIPAARKAMLKIGDDRRVPMRQVYEMYSGRLKPADVLASAQAGNPGKEALNRQLFYAHLYVGIHYDLEGDAAQALEHLNKATDDHRIGHYMWDVARVHRDLLKKK